MSLNMKRAFKPILEAVTAVSLIAAILWGSALLSLEVKSSAVYRQSRVLTMLLSQEPVGIAGMLEDTRNIDMTVKFAGALTAAYINFELIPVNEAATFVAVFESLPEGVDIEGFEYHRKDLHITGVADETGYDAFISNLRGRDYFSSVTGQILGDQDGVTRFGIICVPAVAETPIALY